MRKLAVGILAHVDAGKTTLSEAMLYTAGMLKKLGRVDHKDAFLDTNTLERERGITIFSKQALLSYSGIEITLLDTPGHVDFSSEMERTLRVLDYAILVISGTDGIQGHTYTLWQLLKRYHIPTFLFLNKMDLPGAERAALLEELTHKFGDGFFDFSGDLTSEDFLDAAAMYDESAMEEFLESGTICAATLTSMIAQRKIFPCYFGSALHLDGVREFLDGLVTYTQSPIWPDSFGATVFKISRDPQGNRLTYVKVTGGTLSVKDVIRGETDGTVWEEKVDQVRIYSGVKFEAVPQAEAGTVCALTGLTRTFPGMGLGREQASEKPFLEPVFHYRMILPDGCDAFLTMTKLRQLEEEDPQLHLIWDKAHNEIHVQLMGEIQLDILTRIIHDRFGLDVRFDAGSIVYKETLAAPVEGCGHFEPLRHYAEVHLLLEPGEPGSGITFATACSEDVLSRNWQRLIFTHIMEKQHVGVLTGSALTDVSVTLLTGKAHVKHTEGGDFRQATYRAIRQGLRKGESVLLEPWYSFRMELPQASLGHALTDMQRLNAKIDAPDIQGDMAIITGEAPVVVMQNYRSELNAYTKGLGRLHCTVKGYGPCHNPEEVIASIGYDPDTDPENSADSVFCSHGSGTVIPWFESDAHMHLPHWGEEPEEEFTAAPPVRSTQTLSSAALDKELQAIFERTYGPIKRKEFVRRPAAVSSSHHEKPVSLPSGPEYLLVDGYNIIHAWDDLEKISETNLDAARQKLMDMLCNYQGYRHCEVILVFDAYRVKGNPGSVEKYNNIHVIYTKEAETADTYIERATYELGKDHRVRVATSDGAEQMIILGHGALRLSARIFRQEMDTVLQEISGILDSNAKKTPHSGKVENIALIQRNSDV